MGSQRDPARRRRASTEAALARLQREIEALGRRMSAQDERLRRLAKEFEAQRRRQEIVSAALQIGDRPRRGERGVIRDLQESIVRLEDYLLRTGDRIENILSALKQHRELLVGMNKRVLNVGTKDRIRLELDTMKNTLSILALNGVELDQALPREIERLRKSLHDQDDVQELEKAKAELDKRFDGELRKFDLDAIWAKKKEIPGYG